MPFIPDRDQPDHDDGLNALASLLELREWDLTCAACGASWTVSVTDILGCDSWTECPRCHRADHAAATDDA